MNNKRLDYIDILKGFAIFLMVMAHILIGVQNSGDQTVSQIIYTFHMPLFMFMSGYVLDLNRKNNMGRGDFKKLFKKRVGTLIVPGIIWMLMGYVINHSSLTFPWFLRTLFEIIIVVYIVMWFTKRIGFNQIGNVSVLLLLYVILFILKRYIEGTFIDEILNMARLQIFYPYFAFGYLFRRYEWEKYLQKFQIISISIVLFVLTIYVGNSYSLSHGVQSCMRYITAISGIIICYCVAKSLNTNNTIVKIFNYLGVYSLNIYLISPFFQPCPEWVGSLINDSTIDGEVFHKTSMFIQIVAGFILTSYTVLICMAITKICERSKIINKILFGK